MNDPSHTFFRFDSFDEEVARKLASLTIPAEVLAERLWDDLRQRGLPARDIQTLGTLFERLKVVPFDDMYPGYLTHPIRVAASVVPLLSPVRLDDVAFGLCHNINEAGSLATTAAGIAEVRKLLSPEVQRRIDILTIDRARERDPAYLNQFYDTVAADGDLLTAKALDKLDNTLWWVEFDVEAWDADIVVSHVCPRLAARQPRLATYLAALVPYTLDEQNKQRLRRKPS